MRRRHVIYRRCDEAYIELAHKAWLLGFRYRLHTDRADLIRSVETNLYAIWDSTAEAIKIGVAKSPDERLAGLQIGNPRPLKLLGACPATQAIERRFHQAAAPWRIQGEWFSTSKEILALVSLILAGEDIAEDMVASGGNDWADAEATLDHLTFEFTQEYAAYAA